MDDIDRMVSTVRGRNVLKDVSEAVHRRMPCGDSRIAERLRALGAIRLVDPKRRDMTNAWALTALGKSKL